MHETAGQLAPAITRYLKGERLSNNDIVLIRAYLVQWIESPVWATNPQADDASREELKQLRIGAHKLANRRQIEHWVEVATDWGMDPL